MRAVLPLGHQLHRGVRRALTGGNARPCGGGRAADTRVNTVAGAAVAAVAAVEFERVTLRFGEVTAVDDLSLAIEHGEFFSLLGPSGSGKTSCLRLIAGFERPTAGRIFLGGAAAENLPPYRRDVNTVFQDYALFPHLTVRDNVAYSLMIQKVGRARRRRLAERMLERVRLGGLAQRKPAELSGGQRQRVSLARALINRPPVLLLDEPLGALDLKLREEMQEELKALQRDIGITFIYVTHDQQEALAMSDRVAVFEHGRVRQVSAPRELYTHPANRFVANFVGVSNLLGAAEAKALFGIDSAVAIRPECIQLRPIGEGGAADGGHAPEQLRLTATVADVVFQGHNHKLALDCGAAPAVTLTGVLEHQQEKSVGLPRPGERWRLLIDRADIQSLDE